MRRRYPLASCSPLSLNTIDGCLAAKFVLWHGYADMNLFQDHPFVVTRGEVPIFDQAGTRYLDRTFGRGPISGRSVMADLADYGQARELIEGAETVVHLAANPASGIHSEAETFRVNILSTYNVFAAAVAAGTRRVVWASSAGLISSPVGHAPPIKRSERGCGRGWPRSGPTTTTTRSALAARSR